MRVWICLAGLIAAVSAWPAAAQTVQWRPGITSGELSNARVVRVQPNLRLQDLQALRNDQTIETPSGRRLNVGRFRAIQQAVVEAKERTARPRPQSFRILAPTPRLAAVPLRPRETAADILARPPEQVVRLEDGKTATVAQLRAIAPYVQQRYGLSLASKRAAPQGPALRIRSVTDLKSLPRNSSDNTILETPSGKRITVGELRAATKERGVRRSVTVVRGAQ